MILKTKLWKFQKRNTELIFLKVLSSQNVKLNQDITKLESEIRHKSNLIRNSASEEEQLNELVESLSTALTDTTEDSAPLLLPPLPQCPHSG